MLGIIRECYAYLKEHAIGSWYESHRFLVKGSDDYVHRIQREMQLLRVETRTKRAFYWIYRPEDAVGFSEFVGLKLKAECHEVIVSSRCRLFYDIDLALDEFQQLEFAEHYGYQLSETNKQIVMEKITKQLATVFKEATLLSLEEHGVDTETLIDWMWTMRNRPGGDGEYKISIHLISNLMLSPAACSIIIGDVKRDILSKNETFLDISSGMVDALVQSIDVTQYRRHGSLSLPFGTKHTSHGSYTNWIIDAYNIPGQRYFITMQDQFTITDVNLSGYKIIDKSNYKGTEACPVFVKDALAHVSNIKDYNPRVWDLEASVLKRSTMYVKRYAPSKCSICDRTHDKDNTLFLIFNSELGIASWKCARVPTMKPIVFYAKENDTNESDIEAFTATYVKANKPIKAAYSTTNAEHDDDIEAFNKRYKKLHQYPTSAQDLADPFDVYGGRARKTFMRYGAPKQIIDDFRELTGKEYDSDDTSIQLKIQKTRVVRAPRVNNRPLESLELHEVLETYEDEY
jgi:hypothetical protein